MHDNLFIDITPGILKQVLTQYLNIRHHNWNFPQWSKFLITFAKGFLILGYCMIELLQATQRKSDCVLIPTVDHTAV